MSIIDITFFSYGFYSRLQIFELYRYNWWSGKTELWIEFNQKLTSISKDKRNIIAANNV